ncbi:hypothetical protein Tco_0678585 [Tanacetum coccineum]|uniref:Uncharacterized protein n=1 Tax=Tanacetum coccineum TaxID=301880 RepID=A0ABQ4XGS8_9ASTR
MFFMVRYLNPYNILIHDDSESHKAWDDSEVIRGSNTLSWKPCQGGSSKLKLPDHRYKRRCCSLIPAESNSLPDAHIQATNTYYKHQELNTKTFANSDIHDLPKSYQDYQDNDFQGRLLASFQDDA